MRETGRSPANPECLRIRRPENIDLTPNGISPSCLTSYLIDLANIRKFALMDTSISDTGNTCTCHTCINNMLLHNATFPTNPNTSTHLCIRESNCHNVFYTAGHIRDRSPLYSIMKCQHTRRPGLQGRIRCLNQQGMTKLSSTSKIFLIKCIYSSA